MRGVAVNLAAPLAADPGVARCARSLTHLGVRSLSCSLAPSARLAMGAASRFFSEDEGGLA
jgi:hypothetical protein